MTMIGKDLVANCVYRFPYRIGYDAAGVVKEVGSAVARVKVGDEVYVRLPEVSRGKKTLGEETENGGALLR